MYLAPELVEEILLGLPLISILRFKTVSTQWKSILESRRFAESRMNNVQKMPQILAVRDHRTESRFKGDEEVEMVYLQCEAAARGPSLTCDGLVCIPVPGWVNVLNPCTGELVRFPSGPNPVNTHRYDGIDLERANWLEFFPGYWSMGFGKDKVSGSYKIVRIFYDTDQSEILDLNIGKWRKLPSPPHYVDDRKHSTCVNGSIYWFQVMNAYRILALDLHTEQFRNVTPPPIFVSSPLANLKDRLAIVRQEYERILIWTLDTQEETWTETYSIPVFHEYISVCVLRCIPLMVSKKGNLYFHDSQKRLFKYYPETDQLRCIAEHIRVLSPFVENMVSLRHPNVTTTYPPGFQYPESWISKFFRRIKLSTPTTVLLTTTVVALVFFRFSSRSM